MLVYDAPTQRLLHANALWIFTTLHNIAPCLPISVLGRLEI
jgi:hypothetical protein